MTRASDQFCLITYRPVIIQVAELVGETLDVVRLHAAGVKDHIVVCGSDSALTDRL